MSTDLHGQQTLLDIEDGDSEYGGPDEVFGTADFDDKSRFARSTGTCSRLTRRWRSGPTWTPGSTGCA